MGNLAGWPYWKVISITGQAGAGTDYQVKLTIGDSAGGDFHLEGHCTNFPQDIRITDDDGTTLLDHWVEDLTADPIVVHVEVKDDLGSNRDVRVYYGKSGESSASNITNTFLFGDDFSGSSLDSNKWDTVGTPAISISSSIMTMTCNAAEYIESKTFTQSPPSIMEVRSKDKNYGSLNYPAGYGFGHYHATTYDTYGVRREAYTAAQYMLVSNDLSGRDITGGISRNTNFATYKISWTTSIAHIYENGVKKDADDVTTHIPTGALKAVIGRTYYKSEANTFDIDWIFVRKYNDPEPAFSSAGAEQSAGWSDKIIGVSSPGKVNGISAANISKIIGVS